MTKLLAAIAVIVLFARPCFAQNDGLVYGIIYCINGIGGPGDMECHRLRGPFAAKTDCETVLSSLILSNPPADPKVTVKFQCMPYSRSEWSGLK